MKYYCLEHNKELKGPNKANKYWHLIDYAKQLYCSVDPSELDTKARAEADSVEEAVNHSESDKSTDWDAKDRQYMAQTAMNTAGEITAALINVKAIDATHTDELIVEVKAMANKFYNELKRMKDEND